MLARVTRNKEKYRPRHVEMCSECMRTAKSKTILHNRAVWSVTSLSANKTIGYYRMHEWKANARMTRFACAGGSRTAIMVSTLRVILFQKCKYHCLPHRQNEVNFCQSIRFSMPFYEVIQHNYRQTVIEIRTDTGNFALGERVRNWFL